MRWVSQGLNPSYELREELFSTPDLEAICWVKKIIEANNSNTIIGINI